VVEDMLASGGSSNGERPLPSMGEWTAVASAKRGVRGTWRVESEEVEEDSDAVRSLFSWSGVGFALAGEAVLVCATLSETGFDYLSYNSPLQ
jgi:hypothetical protein